MECPNCRAAAVEGAAECPRCGVIFAKWDEARKKPRPPAVAHNPLGWRSPYVLAAGAALIPALGFALRFRAWLPIPEAWITLENMWFPISALNVVFHEAGHAIFGILGMDFLTVAGGTLVQLAMPSACLVHFLKRESRAGVMFTLFWIGINLIEVSWYAADAKMQVVILISGLSGSEGGGHDWGHMLGSLGLTDYCVGIGQSVFLLGCWLVLLPPLWVMIVLWRDRLSKASIA